MPQFLEVNEVVRTKKGEQITKIFINIERICYIFNNFDGRGVIVMADFKSVFTDIPYEVLINKITANG